MSPRPPTIRDLAARLGLSTATVSLALRKHPSVKAATRDRILAEAAQRGYQPNALVNALMAQVRTRKRLKPTGEVVAYLTSSSSEKAWLTLPSHAQQFEGARERAEQLGFSLQPFWLGEYGINSRQLRRMLQARGVRGSLLAPVAIDHHTLELDWAHHAVVTIGYSFRQIALHRAVHDHINLMEACYLQLHKLGHKRVGLVTLRSENVRLRHLWTTGYLGVQWQHSGDQLQPLLLDNYDDPAPFIEWIRSACPDAVIGNWPDRTLDWMRECRIRIPEDVSYATLDLGDRVGKIAGVLQDNKSIGAAAMDLLAGQLFRNEIGTPPTPKITMVEGTWMDGSTATRAQTERPAQVITSDLTC